MLSKVRVVNVHDLTIGSGVPMIATVYPHIVITSEGVPVIAGTRTKVEEVVLDYLAHDWDADEITIGQAVRDLEMICQVLEEKDMRNEVTFLPF
jgi:uncharacterized protein (DUF433 family)